MGRRWLPHLSMASTLAAAFGGLLALTLGLTLLIGLYVAGTNTRELLAARVNLTLEGLETGVTQQLQPVETVLEALRVRFASQGANDPAGLYPYVQGMLAATPQISGIAIVGRDGSLLPFGRNDRAPPVTGRVEDRAALARAFEALGRHDSVVWGNAVWDEATRATVINARISLRRPGAPEAMLVAGVRLETFVAFVNALSRQIGQPVFVLSGQNRVVGYTGFRPDAALLGPDQPLPPVAAVADPVLRQIWKDRKDALDLIGDLIVGRAHEVTALDRPYIFVYRAMQGYTDLPWLIGTYLPKRLVDAPVERLVYLGFGAVFVVLLAMLAVFRLGRRLARPVERLALRADRIRALELDGLAPLPLSHVVELDRAARAFNAMTIALHQFQAYLPRRVVGRLIRGGPAAMQSFEERAVTVMFTDIQGFSAKAAGLGANATADLLNAHFTLLERPIDAAGGTIDKFVGDSVMAFWGAPGDDGDHAVRAARAALAIRRALEDAEDGVRIRVGLHTGLALVGNIGAPNRHDYTLVGDTVNVAQHVEQLGRNFQDNEPGPALIVLSAATAAAIKGADGLDPFPRGLFWRKDRTTQIELYGL